MLYVYVLLLRPLSSFFEVKFSVGQKKQNITLVIQINNKKKGGSGRVEKPLYGEMSIHCPYLIITSSLY